MQILEHLYIQSELDWQPSSASDWIMPTGNNINTNINMKYGLIKNGHNFNGLLKFCAIVLRVLCFYFLFHLQGHKALP